MTAVLDSVAFPALIERRYNKRHHYQSAGATNFGAS